MAQGQQELQVEHAVAAAPIDFSAWDVSPEGAAILDRIFNGPRRHLFTYQYWDPCYRQHITIDSIKIDAAEALRDLRRYLGRENRRRQRNNLPLIPLPRAYHLVDETVKAECAAEVRKAFELTAPAAA